MLYEMLLFECLLGADRKMKKRVLTGQLQADPGSDNPDSHSKERTKRYAKKTPPTQSVVLKMNKKSYANGLLFPDRNGRDFHCLDLGVQIASKARTKLHKRTKLPQMVAQKCTKVSRECGNEVAK